MIGYIFFEWLDHFLCHLNLGGGISQSNKHLFIIDGHGSHLTIDVIKKAWLGIWPFDSHKMDNKMTPMTTFTKELEL
jgi:hypothetical protein